MRQCARVAAFARRAVRAPLDGLGRILLRPLDDSGAVGQVGDGHEFASDANSIRQTVDVGRRCWRGGGRAKGSEGSVELVIAAVERDQAAGRAAELDELRAVLRENDPAQAASLMRVRRARAGARRGVVAVRRHQENVGGRQRSGRRAEGRKSVLGEQLRNGVGEADVLLGRLHYSLLLLEGRAMDRPAGLFEQLLELVLRVELLLVHQLEAECLAGIGEKDVAGAGGEDELLLAACVALELGDEALVQSGEGGAVGRSKRLDEVVSIDDDGADAA